VELVTEIKSAARELGFEVVGVTSVAPLREDDQRYSDWCQSGFAADMDYMTRRPDLPAHPQRLVPWAKSLVTLAVNYYAEASVFRHDNQYGRVARYAWGRDYHEVVKPRLLLLASRAEELSDRKVRARAFIDAVPLLERAVAVRAGLGFFGKNTNLLQPKRGSWFFLAELLLDIELPAEGGSQQISCGTCKRCLDACPTDAFAGPHVLDSSRCISYLTIENKGAIPPEMRPGLGEWVFGCDVCQDVCPFNRFSSETDWHELKPEAGVGPRLDLSEVLSISTDEEFRARFRGTALSRPKRRGLLRNAAVVAANVGCDGAVPALVERLEGDSEPLIRSHAMWSLGQLDVVRARSLAESVYRSDPDPGVRYEAEALLAR
jgi:epoxyqueuosine reductase